MKTTDEALEEVLKRKKIVQDRRQRRTNRLLSAAAGTVMLAIVLFISVMPDPVSTETAIPVQGAFMLSADIGGYVIAVVLGFILGMLVTLLAKRKKTPEL